MESTSEKILNYIDKNHRVTGKELTEYLNSISSRAVRKQLKNLVEKNMLQKIGKPPKVWYLLADNKIQTVITIKKNIQTIIDKRYYFISNAGEAQIGWKGFVSWCQKTKQEPIKTSQEYIDTLKKYDRFRKNNLIDGMIKMKSTFKKVFLNQIFYLDFYSIERFGKTKLGQKLLYSKQSQNKELINELIVEIRPQILKVISKYDINGVLFIPPSVKREIQFMKELEKQLHLLIKPLNVGKIKTPIIIPQKTLSKLEDRIENAKQTIIVQDDNSYKNILLIDDAVGSGATLNETAKQIKQKNLCTGQIIGLAITGSFKGFDVISEV
ncbi:MAG: hypothetical protein ACD_26C00134G0001 [uncultured bacterium]|nr:MAG: hypothetical protein ACD_26C00134G0001 [uncultured bacterium]